MNTYPSKFFKEKSNLLWTHILPCAIEIILYERDLTSFLAFIVRTRLPITKHENNVFESKFKNLNHKF
jgi:hypothetical protein